MKLIDIVNNMGTREFAYGASGVQAGGPGSGNTTNHPGRGGKVDDSATRRNNIRRAFGMKPTGNYGEPDPKPGSTEEERTRKANIERAFRMKLEKPKMTIFQKSLHDPLIKNGWKHEGMTDERSGSMSMYSHPNGNKMSVSPGGTTHEDYAHGEPAPFKL